MRQLLIYTSQICAAMFRALHKTMSCLNSVLQAFCLTHVQENVSTYLIIDLMGGRFL